MSVFFFYFFFFVILFVNVDDGEERKVYSVFFSYRSFFLQKMNLQGG